MVTAHSGPLPKSMRRDLPPPRTRVSTPPPPTRPPPCRFSPPVAAAPRAIPDLRRNPSPQTRAAATPPPRGAAQDGREPPRPRLGGNERSGVAVGAVKEEIGHAHPRHSRKAFVSTPAWPGLALQSTLCLVQVELWPSDQPRPAVGYAEENPT